ncbi:AraC family transcriptional regulator [Algibacillus agarilyticus]|uniref:AraC family transcriptional regulator n=1 Tax=Algibacillus agarilyticus TaxID=2234133 RepID=UPI000DCFA703|nr:AraC family transcriptional regulator [Algibacillus agarilyticus]
MTDVWQDVLEIGTECNERFVEREKVPEIENLNIEISGISNLAGRYQVGRSNPISHDVIYSIEGAIDIDTEQGHFTIGPGNLITLPAHKPFLMTLNAPAWNMVWFHLDDCPRWNNLCDHRPLSTACESGRQLYHLLSFIYYERNASLRKPALKQLEYYLEETLCAPSPGSSESHRINQLIRDIERRLHYAWTVDEMSDLVQYSSPHLHRLFQTHFARSPIQHVIYLRMERAKYLLTHTNWSIEQIAEQVGYQDVFNFSKRFKKSIGFPPGQFRKQNN